MNSSLPPLPPVKWLAGLDSFRRGKTCIDFGCGFPALSLFVAKKTESAAATFTFTLTFPVPCSLTR